MSQWLLFIWEVKANLLLSYVILYLFDKELYIAVVTKN